MSPTWWLQDYKNQFLTALQPKIDKAQERWLARGKLSRRTGQFFVCGKAALRRQLIDEPWYKLRQLRGHFLFGQACLFRQSLNNGRTKRRSE